MKIQFLGTAAAEGWPAMFCKCAACKKAATLGGRNIRTRSQALIDDYLLIDFPADTYLHVLHGGLDLTEINHCLITHKHSDHLYAEDFEMRRKGFAHLEEETLLTVYGSEPTEGVVQDVIDRYGLESDGRVKFQKIIPFKPFKIEKYEITPLAADHDSTCQPLIYIISDGEKTLLYGNDTGYFLEETWAYLEKVKPRLDFISLDCTFGGEFLRHHHMGIKSNEEVKERLLQMGIAHEKTVFCAHHFSHNGKLIYDEMVPLAEEAGFIVSYDGLVVQV